jgi:pimeloyl-ACP methyl ester carboxylesterase
MSEAILVPQVGQDLTEAKVVALHVKLGDPVKRGDIVAEVESEKSTFEVEAFANGIVTALPYKVGDIATVLEPLIVLGAPGAAAAPASGTAAMKAERPAKGGKPAASPEVVGLNPARTTTNGKVRSSPLARRVAQSKGLDLTRIAGSGPDSAIVLRDVEGAVAKSDKSSLAATLAGSASATSLNVKTLKDGTGTPIVFIHGFGAEIAAWRHLALSLTLPNPLIALDLPGHGQSPEAAQPGFQGLVAAVADTLRRIGPECHLVAHSLGAAVAIAATGQTGIRIKSLCLVAPAGLGPTVDGRFVEGFLAARSEVALAAQMRSLVADVGNLPASMVRATFAARENASVVTKLRRVAEAVFEGSTQLVSVRAELEQYKGPARIIVGRRDAVIAAAETEAAVPAHVALHRVEAGHLPFIEQEALVARLIAETVRSGG